MRRVAWERGAVGFGLALVFCLAVLVVLAADWSVVRATGFGHSRRCLHTLMTQDLDRRSVVIVGSSRAAGNLDPNVLAAAMELPSGAIVDLGHPERELALDAAMVRAVSHRASLRMAIVELHVASDAMTAIERRLDPSEIPAAARLSSGTYSERYVIASRIGDLFDRLPPGLSVASARDGLVLALKKIELTVKVLGDRSWLSILRRSDEGIDASSPNRCLPRASSPAAARLGTPREAAQRAAFRSVFGAPTMPRDDAGDFLTTPARRADRASVDAIVANARARHFVPVFVYLPSVNMPVPDAVFAGAFERRFGATLLIPDRALRDRLAVDGYYDNAHLNPDGQRRLSAWIAPRLKALLAAPR